MKNFGYFVVILILGIVAVVLVITTRFACGAIDVIADEVNPQVLQAKYEEFKDMYATLEAKKANIAVQAGKLINMENMYTDIPRTEWDRSDINNYNLWQSEVDGTVMSYNLLASEYNAAMAKWNWRFCNIGTLPEGADVPLPREFAPYEYE